MKNIITLKQISKSFTQKQTKSLFSKRIKVCVLNDISFSLKKGTILGLLGPNGAGKTTLLKIISTLILPEQGKVQIKDCFLGKNDTEIKSTLSLVSSNERSFYWRLSGLANLEFFAAMYGMEKKLSQSRIAHLLEEFQINYANRRFDSYSTGMKRKFMLIKALLPDPEILLLDEPFQSLDHETTVELRDHLLKLRAQDKTIIFATHNIEEANNLCNQFIILSSGKNKGIGALSDLKNLTNLESLSEIYLKLTHD